MKRILTYILSLLTTTALYAEPLYFCTAADSAYFPHLLNLIGSIHHSNYQNLGEIAVYNLGMTENELTILKSIEKVGIYDIDPIHPDLLKLFKIKANGENARGWYAWKWVAIKQALEKFPFVLWLDAKSTVLRPLNHLFDYIKSHDYFLCTNIIETECNTIRWGATQYVMKHYNLVNKWILDQNSVNDTIIGIRKEAKNLFITDLYQLVPEIRFFADDCTAGNGFGDCKYGQTLLSIIAHAKKLDILIHEKNTNSININGFELYITENSQHITEKTHIYTSHNDLSNFNYFSDYIWFKNGLISQKEAQNLQEYATQNCNKSELHMNYILAQECIKNNIAGSFVECGVSADSTAAVMLYAIQKNNCDKLVFMYDENTNPIELAIKNMQKWQLNTGRVVPWAWHPFENLFPQNSIPRTSLLRLNTSEYNSTKACLEYFYPLLKKGGFIIITNYQSAPCKKAVDEYIINQRLNPHIKVISQEYGTVYWQINDTCYLNTSSYPYMTGDTLREFCDHAIEYGNIDLNIESIHCGDTIFLDLGYADYFFKNIHPRIKNKYILVTSSSDNLAPGKYIEYLNEPQLYRWCGINCSAIHDKFLPIALGFQRKRYDNGNIAILDIYGKQPWKLYTNKEKLLYMNFTIPANPVIRSAVQKHFESIGLSSMASLKPFEEYLAEMSLYKFVVCPIGLGLDCCKTWEALLVGCIPIVQSTNLDVLYKDLPVVIVDDWLEVTKEFLEKKYEEMMKKQYTREKLFADYWLNIIREQQENARRNP